MEDNSLNTSTISDLGQLNNINQMEDSTPISQEKVYELNINDIIPNRFQPREIFDEKALNELAVSIKEHGIIQPIIVRQIGEKYEIIAGERRYKASVIAGKNTISAIIKNLDDSESSKVALLENLQRKDLTPIELARTYQNILQLGDMTQDQLAKTLGVSQSAVANKMRLLNLNSNVQEALLKEQISERHARSLLNVKSQEKQDELLHKIINERMTVKDLDDEIANLNGKVSNVETAGENIVLSSTETLSDENLTESNVLVDNSQNNDIPPLNINSLPKTASDIDELGLSKSLFPVEEKVETLEELSIPEKNGEISDLNNQTQNKSLLYGNASTYETNPSGNIYDLRFAINNIRQVIQSTQKFGFQIETEEFDFDDIYQIVIKIDKK